MHSPNPVIIHSYSHFEPITFCEALSEPTPHCKTKLVVLSKEWLPYSCRQAEEIMVRLCITNCIRQPLRKLPRLSYNHDLALCNHPSSHREDGRSPGQLQKEGPRNMDCARRVWGHAHRRFYMLWSVFWGLLKLFFVHTQYMYTCMSMPVIAYL